MSSGTLDGVCQSDPNRRDSRPRRVRHAENHAEMRAPHPFAPIVVAAENAS